MKLTIDTDRQTLGIEAEGASREIGLYSKEAFELISRQWLKVGWNQKYPYTFSWLGRPVIQIPEDIIRIQEVIYRIKPDVIVETGVAHGGSLVFSASLCKLMGKGRVVGVDIEIRPHNRKAIEAHEMSSLITLVEGDSTAPEIVGRVAKLIQPGEKVLVILDSCHTKDHVQKELAVYAPLVGVGSYIVATDGSMRDLWDVPRGNREWREDHPCAAVEEFLKTHPEFVLEQPDWPFNESALEQNITHWPDSFLRRMR
jgi:cephalosporin hydroxylase